MYNKKLPKTEKTQQNLELLVQIIWVAIKAI